MATRRIGALEGIFPTLLLFWIASSVQAQRKAWTTLFVDIDLLN
jgi:hypothetical protein